MSAPENTFQSSALRPKLTVVSHQPTEPMQYINEALEADMMATTPESFHEIFRYTLLDNSTSRIRPVLALITGEALGLTWEATTPLALGIDKFHNMSLIEDDMPYQDNSAKRRDKHSAWKQFGVRQAHMAALAMFNGARNSIAQGDTDHYLGGALNRYTGVTVDRMLVDQNRDLDSFQTEEGAAKTIDELDEIAAGKTGLLFEMSTLGVAILAGVSPAVRQGLQEYGSQVGLAKQVRNDLVDLSERGDDARNGKPTYISVMGSVKPVEAKLWQHVERAAAAIEPLAEELDVAPLVQIARHIGRPAQAA